MSKYNMKTSTNPCNYSPSEKALRALLMLGSLGKTDLTGTRIAYGIDQVLALVVNNGMDVSSVLKPGDDEIIWLTDIVKYANTVSFETKDLSVKVSADGPETFTIASENEAHDVERVFFTVPSGDIQDMAVSVKAISAMVKATTGIVLSDMLDEENEIDTLVIGSSPWTDSRGNNVDLTVAITRATDMSRSRIDTLAELADCKGTNIGVFDGKWYHPSINARRTSSSFGSKSIWKEDAIIVTVPFGSFSGEIPKQGQYPTRRNPRLGQEKEIERNPDFDIIVENIPKAVSPVISSPVKAAEVANWLVADDREHLAALGFGRWRTECDIVGAFLRCTFSGTTTIDFDTATLLSNGDFTVKELLNSENGSCFRISLGKNSPVIAKGPYVIANMDVAKAVALGNIKTGTMGRSIEVPRYEESSSKKGADNVFAHGYVPDGTLKYASKTSQNDITRSSLELTPVFPMGAALSRISEKDYEYRWSRTPDYNSKPARFVLIVDASRAGVQAVRSNIAALVALTTEIPESTKEYGDAILACILPKDEAGTPWDEDEIADMKEKWIAYATMAADYSHFVSADDLDACIAVEKENKSKRRKEGKTVDSDAKIADELRKMISDAEVVEREHIRNGQTRSPYRSYGRAKSGDRSTRMIKSPEQWAVVVTDEESVPSYRGMSKAASIAKLCYALDIVDAKVENIVTVSMSHWSDKRAKILEEIGIALLYDDTNKVKEAKPVLDAECFSIDKIEEAGIRVRRGLGRTFPTSIAYLGNVPDKYEPIIAEIEKMRVVGQLFDGLNRNFMSGVDVGSTFDMNGVPRLVRAMSFDTLNTDGFPIPSEEEIRAGYPNPKTKPAGTAPRRPPKPGGTKSAAPADTSDDIEWRKIAFSDFSFPNIKSDVMAKACDADMIEKFSDICKLWKTYLFEAAGMTFTISAINENNVENFKGVGAACGVDTAVQAYMIGVPIEDLIEE